MCEKHVYFSDEKIGGTTVIQNTKHCHAQTQKMQGFFSLVIRVQNHSPKQTRRELEFRSHQFFFENKPSPYI